MPIRFKLSSIFVPKLTDLSRYFLKLAYDGTDYCGWQIQPEVSTVQETLEKALKILAPDIHGVVGCGRTDTGVHAKEYFAHFDSEVALSDQFIYKINRILPLSISVFELIPVSDTDHARFSATARGYSYYIHFDKDPFNNLFSVFHRAGLDIDKMNEACKFLLGQQDFTSFSKGKTQTKTNLCDIAYAEWKPTENGMVFEIKANRFLRNMVRAIVGTMFLVGEGVIEPNKIADIVAAKDRSRAGKSAHPQGLFLDRIDYPIFHG